MHLTQEHEYFIVWQRSRRCGERHGGYGDELRSCRGWVEQVLHNVGHWKNWESNVVKTIINHPFGNGLYHPFMVMLGMLMIVLSTFVMVMFDINHVGKYGVLLATPNLGCREHVLTGYT